MECWSGEGEHSGGGQEQAGSKDVGGWRSAERAAAAESEVDGIGSAPG